MRCKTFHPTNWNWCIDLKILKKNKKKSQDQKSKKNKKDKNNSVQKYLIGQEPGHSQVTARCHEQNTAIGSEQEPGHSQVTFKRRPFGRNKRLGYPRSPRSPIRKTKKEKLRSLSLVAGAGCCCAGAGACLLPMPHRRAVPATWLHILA